MTRLPLVLLISFAIVRAYANTAVPTVLNSNYNFPTLVTDGDSQMNGGPVSPFLTSYIAADLTTKNLFTGNVAIPGETVASMAINCASHMAPLYKASVPFIATILGGGNDIRAGDTAAQIYASLQSWVACIHNLGPNAKAIISTYTIQCDIFENGTENAVLEAYNNLIYANWNVPQSSGGLGADALIDYFADPTVGDNIYTASAYCSGAWSSDGQHLNAAGNTILAGIAAPVIALLLR